MRHFREDLKRIVHADGERVCAGTRRRGDIQFKRQVAAFMLPNFDVIQPDFGEVIHCAKAKDDDAIIFKPRCGNLEVTLVPRCAGVIAKARVGLPGGRDGNQ